jgi:hypothetical protein
LQFLLWLFFYYTVAAHFIEWLPTVGMHFPILKILVYSFFYVVLQAVFPYIHSYYLSPRFYKKGKKIYYYLWLITGVALSLVLFVCLDYAFAYPDIPGWFFIPLHFFSRIPYIFMFMLAIHLFKLRAGYYEQKSRQLMLEKEKSDAEVKFLKAQINPHFLFNTLNNIQSLAFTQPQKASETIVHLSGLFRYISYEGKRDQVPLGDEIGYIKNYLSLSVMKKSWADKVTFTASEADGTLLIEPLLLVNFIENAFKHGTLEADGDFIKIELKTTPQYLFFECCNTFMPNNKPSGLIGLENVKKRLELAYPHRHTLETSSNGNVYFVKLAIRYAN